MGLEMLATSAISILVPYVSAGAKKAAEVAGEKVAKAAGELLSGLRRWFSGDEEAEEVLANFEKRPSRYGETVKTMLLEKAEAGPALRDELEKIIESAGSPVEVVQDVRKLAGEVLGMDLAKWEKMSARIVQHVDELEAGGRLTGVQTRS
jgi:hypothetical protein